MDAEKVLAVLREIEYGGDTRYCPGCGFPAGIPHKTGCTVGLLIAEAEHEAQTGAWKPGSEPPSDTDRLRSIHENGLCGDWLKESEEPHPTWEKFLELVDEQVAMDAEERSPEFQETIRQAMEQPATRTILPSGESVDLPPLPEQAAGKGERGS